MANLIRMDMRRLFLSKVFIVTMSIAAALNIVFMTAAPVLSKYLAPDKAIASESFAQAFVEPFSISWLVILLLISMVSFTFADFANGYIKNIAGQIPNKSQIIFSKFIVIGVHNIIFMFVGALSKLIGMYAGSAMAGYDVVVDGNIFPGLLTLLIKWLLIMGICSILFFVTIGIRNKTVASIVAVFFGTGTLGLVYMGLNTAIANIFHVNNFAINNYMPDALMNTVDVASQAAVLNAVIAGLVCIAIFLPLTVKVFKARDIK